MAVGGGVADAGVLDVDPEGAVVRSPGDAGDLAAPRTDQEAAHFPGLRIGTKQLVTTGVEGVRSFVVGIGLNPQAASAIEGQAVRGGEDISLDIADQIIRQRLAVRIYGTGLVAGEQEYIPLEGGGGGVGIGLAPAQDLAVLVVGAGVGRIHRKAAAAIAVVGQGDVDFTTARMYGDPFRAVHRCGTEDVGGAPGV